MARKGLPAKYAKYGFKKGWQLYKAAKRKRKTSGSAASKKTVTRKRTVKTSTGGKKVAKKKSTKTGRRVVYRTVKAPKKRTGRRAPKILTRQTFNAVVSGTLIGSGAIGSTIVVNKTPFVKDLNHWFKAAIQTGLGMVLMTFFKDKYMKQVAMGMVVGSAISITLPLLPEGMKVFGGRRRFSNMELHKLQTLGRPRALGKPVAIQGRPVTVSTAQQNAPMMGRSSNRVGRY